jgi:hypothetical protein
VALDVTGAGKFSTGLTVSAGGITATGNSTITGTLGGISTLTATTFSGALSGNASTATALQTARTINGVSFDGTGNITVAAAAGTLTGNTLASGITASSLTSLGTSAVWGTGVANFGTISKRKTADESVTSSTTLQDDDHLTLPIGANEEWTVAYDLDAGTALHFGGIKIAATVPSGATMNLTGSAVCDANTCFSGRTATSGIAAITMTPGIDNNATIRMTLWVLNGATPGNVTLQWAQNTSNATATTVRKGSFMQATRVA